MMSAFPSLLVDEASCPFRASGHFAYYYARGKLAGDGVFAELLKRGVFPASGHFLDLGCGQGSLFSWLLAARRLYEAGDWPSDWPPPPKPLSLHGVELMTKDVERARRAFGASHPLVDVRQGDMRHVAFARVDVVILLDALHYLSYPEQEDVLRRIRLALPAGGVFVTRIGDASAGLAYHLCRWLDHLVTFARGHRLSKLYGRSLGQWTALLESLGFAVAHTPMSGRKPFANTLLVCQATA